MLRGLDDPRKLWAWLRESGRRNLVLRVADVLGLPLADQARLAAFISLTVPTEDSQLRSWWQGQGRGGYVVVPWTQFESMTMDELLKFQELLYTYHEIRRDKGEPSQIAICDCVHGDRAEPGCKYCDGEGQITIFLEISAEEQRLAESK